MRCTSVLLAVLGIAALAGPLMAGEVTILNGDADFPEGPYVAADGRLVYAEYGGHRVSAWDGETNVTLWSQDGCGPSAVMPYQDGMLVTCYDNGTYVKIGAGGATDQVWDADAEGALIGPNDLTADGKGGAFLTASGPWESGPIVGKIYHLSADGTLATVADDLHYANGIQLSADGSLLYVNESEAARVITFAVAADGSLSDRRLFVRLGDLDEPGGYPDGIKLGPDGNLYIGLYSAGRILVVSPAGELVRKIEVPSAAAPNLAFSTDGATLYVMGVDDQANPPYKGKVYAIANE